MSKPVAIEILIATSVGAAVYAISYAIGLPSKWPGAVMAPFIYLYLTSR